MTFTIAMHELSLAHIGERLDALGLDARVLTFDGEGVFRDGAARRPPEEIAADYMWFSSHIHRGGGQDAAFDLALRCKSVGVLQTYNAGLDHPFYARIAARGARICNSSAQGVAIAEYVLGQVMAVMQPIERQREMQAAREWRVTPFRELSRTHWLIAGYGPIGREIEARVAAFGADISVIRRSGAPAERAGRTGGPDRLLEFAADADVVALACPLNDATRGMADAGFFAALKPGAVLVNVGRGGLLDEAALIATLDAGALDRAILDVFATEPLPEDDPLWAHPKVRLTPHTSFAGDGAQARWDALFLDNVRRFARGEPLIREVRPEEI